MSTQKNQPVAPDSGARLVALRIGLLEIVTDEVVDFALAGVWRADGRQMLAERLIMLGSSLRWLRCSRQSSYC